MLCAACLEQRLGRQLALDDFVSRNAEGRLATWLMAPLSPGCCRALEPRPENLKHFFREQARPKPHCKLGLNCNINLTY
jgi:hypothetical protein